MYGLVNKALEDFVTQTFGTAAWEQTLTQARASEEVFISMETYPDSLTYDLVGAACRVVGLPSEALLQSLGEHWIRFTGNEGYGHLLSSCGRSLPEFLKQLDHMHSRVGLTFGYSKMPSFHCTELSSDLLQLDYYSERPGLGPMVVGLLRGLGSLFQTTVTVQYSKSRASGDDHDQFLIRYSQN